MPEQTDRQRSVEDSLRYFVTTLIDRASETDDMELGGMAIALGLTVDRAKAEIAQLRIQLGIREEQVAGIDQRYGAVHEALTLWRSGDIDANEAMRRIHDALGTPAIPGRAA